MPDPVRPLRPAVSPSSKGSSQGPPEPKKEQLSSRNGVRPSVSTATVDRSGLMASVASRPAGSLQPAIVGTESYTDAQEMLRVKAGDQAAFDFLGLKHRRPLVEFKYRSAE